jgi:VWFA-related protein
MQIGKTNSFGTSRSAWPLALAALGLYSSIGIIASSQTQQEPTFRSRTDLVELDVSVLDKNRRPVQGLEKSAFTVLEDGKPQEISLFEAIHVANREPVSAAWMRDVTPDVDTNETKVTRLWVVVVDDALIPADPFAVQTTQKVARDIVDKLGPNDLAAMVFTTDSRKAQDFTNDRTKLLTALDQFYPGWANWTAPPNGIPNNPDWQFRTGAVLTLRNVMQTLVALPQYRKALIWISPGLPPLKSADILAAADSGSPGGVEEMRRIFELTKDMFDLARRSNVPIYPIHPCGLVPAVGEGKCAAAAEGINSLLGTASETGGRAIVNTNDYTKGVSDIFGENDSYYMIGYTSTNQKTDGAFRQLAVKVQGADVTVRTRSNYSAPKRGQTPSSAADTLARAAALPVAVAELPLHAAAGAFAIPGSRTATVAVVLGLTSPGRYGTEVAKTATTDLLITAYTTEGDRKGTQRSVATVTLRPNEALETIDYDALSRIDLPPGRFRLRVAAYQEDTGKTGTVMVDVTVPDFSKESESLSGVVLGATPGRASAPRDLMASVVPLVATAQRRFGRDERATAFFYVYQQAQLPSTPRSVAIRVVDEHGTEVVHETATIAAGQFVTTKALRSAAFEYPLPIGRLPSGRYLLSFEVTPGVQLRRDIQFEVR